VKLLNVPLRNVRRRSSAFGKCCGRSGMRLDPGSRCSSDRWEKRGLVDVSVGDKESFGSVVDILGKRLKL